LNDFGVYASYIGLDPDFFTHGQKHTGIEEKMEL
jgi:hypothetical protein